MNFLHFLQAFTLITVLGALAVTGWFFITRGKIQQLPDGSIKKTGKIFKGWYFFWTMEKKAKKKVFYTGSALKKVVYELNNSYRKYIFKISVDEKYMLIFPQPGAAFDKPDILTMLQEIEYKWSFKINSNSQSKEYVTVAPYEEHPQYIFPSLLRDPLAVCATCFASIYGSIFYWAVILNAKCLFAWTWPAHILLMKIFFWIALCLSLAVLNTALAKKFN